MPTDYTLLHSYLALRSQISMDKREEERKPWALETSIFWKRKKENDSCSVFDSDQVWIRW